MAGEGFFRGFEENSIARPHPPSRGVRPTVGFPRNRLGILLLALLLGSAAGGASANEHPLIREPYLQLGNAPLVGYAGSHTDQVEVTWQSNGTSSGPISFHYRRADSDVWIQLSHIRVAELAEGRVNHSVVLEGLDFDTRYEYRVEHGSSVYTADFRTRLAAGSAKPFVFAAYGDSTDPRSIELFNQVQSAINQSGASFAVLLGDNAYPDGTHADYDNRFRRETVPEALVWNRSQIDYAAVGNHDVDLDGGLGFRSTFSNPIPIAGKTAPATPPPAFPTEHNYSFDYGMAHFTVIDSNTKSLTKDLARWAAADLTASHNRWKIVVLHHPVTGAPDRIATVTDYYKELIPTLVEQEVDLLLAGHSHSYGWTYPMTDFSGDQPTFVLDTDRRYEENAGVVQVISGVGGTDVRNFARPGWPHPVVAAGFASDPSGKAETGFSRVSVSKEELKVEYIAADGDVIDSFSIIAEPEPDIAARLGLANPATGEWVLRYPDGSIDRFYFGNPADKPLYGDWDCDGTSTPGMYRESNGFVYLKNDNTTGPADVDFFFGMDGDIPIAGDWNGDGCDTISIYRQTLGAVFISNVLRTATAETDYFFGNPQDRPFSGDFDGDGIDTVGLYRETSGLAYLRNEHTTGPADIEFFYGVANDAIIAADWNSDGRDTVGIFRQTARRFYLSNRNQQGNADLELRGFGSGHAVAD